ncbi:MAG TPA: thioredoxin domain-containing protein [Gemmatimonadaceae bacterium]|nr:thioredoxin domain-containing protein [Gemmatimonadaceae bacterium]
MRSTLEPNQRQTTGVLVLVALVVGTVAYCRATRAPSAQANSSGAATFSHVVNRKLLQTSGGHVLGVASAPIQAIEFSDLQCPFCARFSAVLDSFLAEHHDSVSVIYRHFPLTTIHPMAYAAAMAAECAGAQGMFGSMVHALFSHQRDFGSKLWIPLAALAGIRDSGEFGRCMRDSSFASAIHRDMEAGRAVGVAGTPSLVLGNTRIEGAVSLHTLDSILLTLGAVPSPESTP